MKKTFIGIWFIALCVPHIQAQALSEIEADSLFTPLIYHAFIAKLVQEEKESLPTVYWDPEFGGESLAIMAQRKRWATSNSIPTLSYWGVAVKCFLFQDIRDSYEEQTPTKYLTYLEQFCDPIMPFMILTITEFTYNSEQQQWEINIGYCRKSLESKEYRGIIKQDENKNWKVSFKFLYHIMD